MSTLARLALTLAVATSGVAILDAILGGITGEPTVLAAESGMSLPLLLGSVLHAAAYVALALLLHVHANRSTPAAGPGACCGSGWRPHTC